MNNDSKARFNDVDLWIRLLYMILFAVLTWLSRLVLCVIALLQFLTVLFSGADNRSLRDFAASLAEWTLRSFRFICFNTEQKPFPFEDWPEPGSEPAPTAASHYDVVPATDHVETGTVPLEAQASTVDAEGSKTVGSSESPGADDSFPADGSSATDGSLPADGSNSSAADDAGDKGQGTGSDDQPPKP